MCVHARMTYPPDGQPEEYDGLNIAGKLDGGAVFEQIPEDGYGEHNKSNGRPSKLCLPKHRF